MTPSPLARTPEWKSSWRSRIGGGRSAAAAGIHEYMTPLELYMSMVEGVEIDPEQKPDMLRGLLLEPVALQRLQMLYSNLDFQPHDQSVFIHNPRYPWASDLPDGWVAFDGQTIPVQIKVPSPRNWEKLDESVPDYIQCNCVHSAAMNNAPAILLACLNPVTMEIYRQVYEPKPEAIDALMESESAFMEHHIIPRIPPPPQTLGDLKLRWPVHIDGKRVTATDDIAKAHEQLVELKAQNTHLDRLIADLNLDIKTFLEDGEILMSKSGKILATYRSHIQTALDGQALQAAKPDVWAEFAKDRPVRVFLPKKPKRT